MLYHIGTEEEFNIGRFLFDQVTRHVFSNVFAITIITYPRMICGVPRNQLTGVEKTEDVMITDKLLKGTSVADVPLTHTVFIGETSKAGKRRDINELGQVESDDEEEVEPSNEGEDATSDVGGSGEPYI
ncbi:hypothetical protein LIER_40617 [Lithospermum erythrorhizon]|uniref:Uncharacterized protein n=1 Tax=Lithospermum erythrorhizon TaxID=34254 RepID=A0AAV3QXD7_LITER